MGSRLTICRVAEDVEVCHGLCQTTLFENLGIWFVLTVPANTGTGRELLVFGFSLAGMCSTDEYILKLF
jgi:hypothetical protein